MRGIVVLGMHRAGTSLLAELAVRWGADPGADTLSANRWNPRGYFEPQALVALDEELLARLDCHWSVPPDPDAVAGLAADPALVSRARALLAELQGERPWLLKDPRLALLLPFWMPLWGDEVVYLIAVRHPAAVAASLAVRDGFGAARARMLWQYTYGAVLTALERTSAGRCFMSYERLLSAPQAQCARLESFLTQLGPRPGSEALAEVVTPALAHGPASAPADPLHQRLLLRLQDPAAPFEPGRWRPAPWFREHLDLSLAHDRLRGAQVGLREACEEARRQQAAAAGEGARLRAERDSWREEADALRERLQQLEATRWHQLGERGRQELAALRRRWTRLRALLG